MSLSSTTVQIWDHNRAADCHSEQVLPGAAKITKNGGRMKIQHGCCEGLTIDQAPVVVALVAHGLADAVLDGAILWPLHNPGVQRSQAQQSSFCPPPMQAASKGTEL